MRPLPIHRAFAEYSLAVDHGVSDFVAARARRNAGGRRGKRCGAASGVRGSSRVGTILLCIATKVLLQRTMRSAMRLPLTIWKRIPAVLMDGCASWPLGQDWSSSHVDRQ